MKTAVYLRVSTGGQHSDNQIPDIEAEARRRGLVLGKYYCESGSAWTAGHQPELARLLDDLRSGRRKYDILLVWSIDRLCRGGIGQIFTLMKTFNDLGVKVVSIKEPWADNELLLAVTAWIAKFESDLKSQRVKAGQARAKASGKHLGRPQGAVDKQPRHRAGYLGRWAGKQTSAGRQARGPDSTEAE